jgi:hypothetical protein
MGMSYEVWDEPDDGPDLPEEWLDEDDAQELRDRITELEAQIAAQPAADNAPQAPSAGSVAEEGYAFKCDGKLWVVTDPDVAMKWQSQGFVVTPVVAANAQSPDSAVDALTAAARDVLMERERQVSAEGWTPEHDDEHNDCEMVRTVAEYNERALLQANGAKS